MKSPGIRRFSDVVSLRKSYLLIGAMPSDVCLEWLGEGCSEPYPAMLAGPGGAQGQVVPSIQSRTLHSKAYVLSLELSPSPPPTICQCTIFAASTERHL